MCKYVMNKGGSRKKGIWDGTNAFLLETLDPIWNMATLLEIKRIHFQSLSSRDDLSQAQIKDPLSILGSRMTFLGNGKFYWLDTSVMRNVPVSILWCEDVNSQVNLVVLLIGKVKSNERKSFSKL